MGPKIDQGRIIFYKQSKLIVEAIYLQAYTLIIKIYKK